MSAEIKTLREVLPPTADDEKRATVIAMLEEALEEAKAGKVEELVMILKRPGGDERSWEERCTPTDFHSGWIGKLEILKCSWIAATKARRDGSDGDLSA